MVIISYKSPPPLRPTNSSALTISISNDHIAKVITFILFYNVIITPQDSFYGFFIYTVYKEYIGS